MAAPENQALSGAIAICSLLPARLPAAAGDLVADWSPLPLFSLAAAAGDLVADWHALPLFQWLQRG